VSVSERGRRVVGPEETMASGLSGATEGSAFQGDTPWNPRGSAARAVSAQGVPPWNPRAAYPGAPERAGDTA
jgi:hypothetical protein